MEKIIIYGYSPVGEAVYQECLKKELSILCFCEDSCIRKNKASTIVNIYNLKELIQKKINGKFIICIPNAEPVIKKLKAAGYNDWVLVSDFLTNKNYTDFTYLTKPRETSIKEIESCILSHKYLKRSDKLFLRNIDFVITEKCSLRCRDCCNLMQYYKEPHNFTVIQLTTWMDILLQYIDEIYEIRILGGEPFMHPQIHQIIDQLLTRSNIHRIIIMTNGTIFPSDTIWNALEDKKIEFNITDYGDLSRNLVHIQRELEKRGISYHIHKAGGWTKCSDIKKHRRSQQNLIKLYDECCAKNLITLLNGKLYKCPYIANAMNLQAIPLNADDFIDLTDLNAIPSEDAKKLLTGYFNSKEYLSSCDYCNGRSFDDEEIEPAIQIHEPLHYDRRW